MQYKCPYCQKECTGSPPIKGAMADKACCPHCGEMFDKEPNIKKPLASVLRPNRLLLLILPLLGVGVAAYYVYLWL